ncbi:MAG: histidinol-phosphate transaminase [Stomatobaculum sp.]|nr:histidinol-phosphate transaminase [Stomatobaculum sp.]MBR7057258.1 histidinol-phosphate transaminase [Stomatobaculum sp.]
MRLWEQNFRDVEPYTPGEQPKDRNVIKLNTNENPYPPSPAVEKALREMDLARLRKYPDPAAEELTEAIADYYGITKDRVFPGVGSDDVIGMAFLTFFNGPKPVLFPNITYSFYDVWADLFKIPYETPALNENFEVVPEDYFRENGGIVLANPNAPTGVELPLDQLEEIIRRNQASVVIVDEAYVDFGGESALGLTEKYENLLVVQTFSKSRSFAGMRIGFAMGHPDLIAALNRVKYSYNSYTMNTPSIILGAAAIRDRAYFEETTGKIIRTRERVKKELAALGFTFGDSKSNFIFAKREGTDAEKLFRTLKENGIYVRWFSKPLIRDYLRISIGTDEEMDCLLSFLRQYTAD